MERLKVKTDPPVKTLPLTLVPLSAHAEYPGTDPIRLPLLDAFRERWRHILGLDDPKIADLDRDYDANGRPTEEALRTGRVQRGGKATW